MKILAAVIFSVVLSEARAYDCSHVATFKPGGSQEVKVSVSKLSWKQGVLLDEDICSKTLKMNWFDVRGREEEAYYCLKPDTQEVAICETSLAGDKAQVFTVPASWIRNSSTGPVRDFHFHAFIVKENNPQFYYDIFSRSILDPLTSSEITIEGALRTGASNPDDGFWVRVEFKE